MMRAARRRNLRSRAAVLALVFLLPGAVALQAVAQERPSTNGDPEARRKAIEKQVMCPCEDKCGKLLYNCSCSFSQRLRTELNRRIAAGETEEVILAWLEETYTEAIYAAPLKTGFNLAAYILPFVALLVAGGVVIIYLRRLTRPVEAGPTDEAEPIGPSPAEDDPLRDRLEKELTGFDT